MSLPPHHFHHQKIVKIIVRQCGAHRVDTTRYKVTPSAVSTCSRQTFFQGRVIPSLHHNIDNTVSVQATCQVDFAVELQMVMCVKTCVLPFVSVLLSLLWCYSRSTTVHCLKRFEVDLETVACFHLFSILTSPLPMFFPQCQAFAFTFHN
jgi:hypothetical protein